MLPLFKSQAKKTEPIAGPELDREIARVVGFDGSERIPFFSTDDATAVALAESFSRDRGWWHYKKREVYGGWTVGWIQEKRPASVAIKPIQASAPTRALAICRSILKVVESMNGNGRTRSRSPLSELQG